MRITSSGGSNNNRQQSHHRNDGFADDTPNLSEAAKQALNGSVDKKIAQRGFRILAKSLGMPKQER